MSELGNAYKTAYYASGRGGKKKPLTYRQKFERQEAFVKSLKDNMDYKTGVAKRAVKRAQAATTRADRAEAQNKKLREELIKPYYLSDGKLTRKIFGCPEPDFELINNLLKESDEA